MSDFVLSKIMHEVSHVKCVHRSLFRVLSVGHLVTRIDDGEITVNLIVCLCLWSFAAMLTWYPPTKIGRNASVCEVSLKLFAHKSFLYLHLPFVNVGLGKEKSRPNTRENGPLRADNRTNKLNKHMASSPKSTAGQFGGWRVLLALSQLNSDFCTWTARMFRWEASFVVAVLSHTFAVSEKEV